MINLEAMGCERTPEAATAAGALLLYLKSTQKRELSHVTSLTHRDDGGKLLYRFQPCLEVKLGRIDERAVYIPKEGPRLA